MKCRKPLALLTSAATCALLTGAIFPGPAATAAGPGAPATAILTAASADPTGHLGAAQPVPGLAALNAGGQAQVSRIACPSPGSCTAAGSYVDRAGHNEAFVADERNFTWGKAIPIPGLSALSSGNPSDVTALSCSDATHCAIGGWYVDSHGNLNPFVAEKDVNAWDPAHNVVVLDPNVHEFFALVTSLSCPAPGDCTAAVTIPATLPKGGGLARFGVLVSEAGGVWGAPHAPLGFTADPGGGLPEEITSVSCWSPSDCLAGGTYTHVPTGNMRPFVVTESGGTWGHVEEPPSISGSAVLGYDPDGDSQVLATSCTTAGNCAVSGVYTDNDGDQQVFEADEINTAWRTQTLPGSAELNTGGNAVVRDVSCGLPFDCAIAGQITDSATQTQALVAGESGGLWRNAQQILGINDNPGAAALAVSCTGNRHCLAGGSFSGPSGDRQAFVAYENADTSTTDVGTFGGALRVAGNLNAGGNAAVNDVSCSFLSECAIGGFYTDAAGHSQGFVADQSTQTAVSLSISAAKVAAGNEGSERIKVKVTGSSGGTPTGTVAITTDSDLPVCDITVAGGTGTCTLTASPLPPGSYRLIANYSGDQAYNSSVSTPKALTVTPEPTATALTLSAATVKAGHEQAEHLTVRVTPHTSGTPDGQVTITAGKATICVISLRNAKGTCTLAASKLRPGTYHLIATYPGGTPYAASASPRKTLTITS